MKKILLLFTLLICFSNVFAAESISGLKTNSPVPLDTPLVVSGTYLNTLNSNQIYCKGVALDPDKNNAQFDRLTDQLTYTDGSFYFAKKITEPTYFRSSVYIFRVSCGTISQDINFAVAQRESVFNQFLGEVFFIRDNGDEWVYMLGFGVIVVMGIGLLIAIYKKYI